MPGLTPEVQYRLQGTLWRLLAACFMPKRGTQRLAIEGSPSALAAEACASEFFFLFAILNSVT